MTRELEHLVEKQDAMVGEADLAGPGLRAAANQRNIGNSVMRRAKGTIDEESGTARKKSGH